MQICNFLTKSATFSPKKNNRSTKNETFIIINTIFK